MSGPLTGIRVIEHSIWQQGTVAGAMLADLGTDSIKIEGPDSPDMGRWFGGYTLPANPYFENNNRNKRSVVIDLKHPAGRDALYRLIESADVFLTNLRIPAVETLGLTYPELSARNPRLVYAHGTGFGSEGPDAREGAMDIVAQARSGIMSANGTPDGEPRQVGAPVADQMGGLLLAWGILAALYHVQRTGEGQMVNSSILSGQIFAQGFRITEYLFTGKQLPPADRTKAQPLWNRYRGSDGQWFVLGTSQIKRFWPILCQAIGHPELEHDPECGDIATHPEHYASAVRCLDQVFATQPREHWLKRFREAGLFHSAVADYDDLTVDPQIIANDLIVDYEHPTGHYRMGGLPVRLSKTPAAIERPAPEFGQHTEEVLLECGFDWDEIAKLRDCGAIGPRADAVEPEPAQT